jgi:hypothetical protein
MRPASPAQTSAAILTEYARLVGSGAPPGKAARAQAAAIIHDRTAATTPATAAGTGRPVTPPSPGSQSFTPAEVRRILLTGAALGAIATLLLTIAALAVILAAR